MQTQSYFSDPDGDPLTFGISGLPRGTGLRIDPNSGFISGVPTLPDLNVRSMRLTVVVDDGRNGGAQSTFDLKIKMCVLSVCA